MNPSGLVGAMIGGVVGALLWGFFTYLTGWEVGYLAWGVGALVGFGCLCLKGRGQTMATACAIVALLSIVGGKFFATQMAIGEAIDKAARDVHQEMVSDAKDFAAIESELEYPEFMVTHGYTDAEKVEAIDSEELAYFKDYSAPVLRELNVSPAYATWKESEFAEVYRQNMAAAFSVRKLVFDNLGPVDIVFFLLGVVTAFQMTRGQPRVQDGRPQAERAQAERPQAEPAQAEEVVAAAESEAELDEQTESENEAQPQV